MKDIKKKIKKNAELIKKESSDSEKKQQSEKKNIDSGNKEASQNSREHMAPPQLFPENISSRYGITAGIHDQNIYHPFMQVPVRDPRNHGHPSAPPLIFYPPLY